MTKNKVIHMYNDKSHSRLTARLDDSSAAAPKALLQLSPLNVQNNIYGCSHGDEEEQEAVSVSVKQVKISSYLSGPFDIGRFVPHHLRMENGKCNLWGQIYYSPS